MASRRRWRWDEQEQKLVEITQDYVPKARLHLIEDTMRPTVHPVTGKLMDSKSAFRRLTKAAGCVELGSDAPMTAPPPRDLPNVKEDLIRTWDQLSRR